MLSFKDIDIKDKEVITSYTQAAPQRNCDLSFSNLCSWRFLYNTQFATQDGFLILKFWAEGKLVYMTPIGNGDMKKVLDEMMEDAAQEGERFCMLGVSDSMRADLEAIMPDEFHFEADRDYADYLYLRTDLATLAGKKLQAKRNHLNKFRRTYNYEYVPLTPTASANASTWKPNGAKPTTATSTKAPATNAAPSPTPCITSKHSD